MAGLYGTLRRVRIAPRVNVIKDGSHREQQARDVCGQQHERHPDRQIAILSVSGPAYRMPRPGLDDIGALLVQAAAALETALS